GGLVADVTAVAAPEHGADLRGGQLRGRGGGGGPSPPLPHITGVQGPAGISLHPGGGEDAPRRSRPARPRRTRPHNTALCARAPPWPACARGLSAATWRSWWESVRTMPASMCASAASLLAPDTAWRSR